MKSEVGADVLKLNHYAPEHFTQFVWEYDIRPTLKFVFIDRVLSYFFIAFATTTLVILLNKFDHYYLYFDFWAGVLIDVTLLPSFGHFRKSYGDQNTWDNLHWTTRANWLFFSAALPTAVVGAVSYWMLLHKSYPSAFLVISNTVPVGLIIILTIFTAVPMRLLYFVFFVGFYIVYIVFTVAYQMSGRKGPKATSYIYKEMNWNEPGKAVLTAAAGLLIGLVAYFVFCIFSMVKIALKQRAVE